MEEKTRASYDAVAEVYSVAIKDELAAKPLDRAMFDGFAEFCRAVGGPVYDLGCGPGHATRYLAGRGVEARGIDLAHEMIRIARAQNPTLSFAVGSMTAIDAPDASWAGAAALYVITHLEPDERRLAFREIARVLRPGGWLLLAFHVSSADHPVGSSLHLETWHNADVDLTTYFLDPDEILGELRATGFGIHARLDREPWSPTEYPSRRCYVFARRPG